LSEFTEIGIKSALDVGGWKKKDGMNDGDLGGVMGYNTMNFKDDTRRSSYVSFIKGQFQKNLEVKTNTLVHKIIFDDNKNAEGVLFEQDGVKQVAKANNEIVLCAGALETPKLLMLSGVGPKSHLSEFNIPCVEDSPYIGENLHDHPNVCMFLKGNKKIDFGYPQVYGFGRMNPELDLPEGQPDTCLTFMAAPITIHQSMYRMMPAVTLPPKLFFNKFARFMCRRLVDLIFALPKVKGFVDHVYGIVVILGKPTSRGKLRLASANAQDQANIDLAYYETPEDMKTMLDGVKFAKSMAKQQGMREWGSQLLLPPTKSDKEEVLKKWIHSAAMTTFHFCGTCTMGEEEKAPVTTDLKVKGVNRLRVADASVIPEIPVSALNAPSMLIGYRAADFIMNDLQEAK